jgi:hypothetical protein
MICAAADLAKTLLPRLLLLLLLHGLKIWVLLPRYHLLLLSLQIWIVTLTSSGNNNGTTT